MVYICLFLLRSKGQWSRSHSGYACRQDCLGFYCVVNKISAWYVCQWVWVCVMVHRMVLRLCTWHARRTVSQLSNCYSSTVLPSRPRPRYIASCFLFIHVSCLLFFTVLMSCHTYTTVYWLFSHFIWVSQVCLEQILYTFDALSDTQPRLSVHWSTVMLG